ASSAGCEAGRKSSNCRARICAVARRSHFPMARPRWQTNPCVVTKRGNVTVMESLAAAVTLEALAAQPAVARTLTPEARAAALAECAAVLAALAAVPGGQAPHRPSDGDGTARLDILTTKALAPL